MKKLTIYLGKKMGVIVNKENNQNDELSRRISADLRARALESADNSGDNELDLAEDAEYMKDLKKTGKFSWMWIVLIVLAVLSLLSILFF